MKKLKQYLQEKLGERNFTIRELIIPAVKEWLQEKLDWAKEREIYDLANTYKDLLEELN